MRKSDVKAYMLNETVGTKKILYIIPQQLDASWVLYDRYHGYGKAATSKESAKNIVENEINPNCTEA